MKRVLCMLLVLSILCGLFVPAVLAAKPSIPASGGAIWIEDVRVTEGSSATVRLDTEVDSAVYDRVSGFRTRITIDAANTGITAATPVTPVETNGVGTTLKNNFKNTGNGVIIFAGENPNTYVSFKLPNVTKTTSIVLDPFQFAGRNAGSTNLDTVDVLAGAVNQSGTDIVQ